MNQSLRSTLVFTVANYATHDIVWSAWTSTRMKWRVSCDGFFVIQNSTHMQSEWGQSSAFHEEVSGFGVFAQRNKPDVARGVFGKTLLADGVKVVLTRVAPGGKFEMHRDDYGHLFYFLSGEGIVWVGEQQFAAHAGLVVQVSAGEDHAYENAGNEDLMLISLNIPIQDPEGL